MYNHIPTMPIRFSLFLLLVLFGPSPVSAQVPIHLRPNEQTVTLDQSLRPARPDYPILPMALAVKDRSMVVGDTLEVEFVVFEFQNLTSYQFILGFDTAWLQYAGLAVDPGLPISSGNFGLFTIDEGELPSVFAGIEGVSVPNGTVFFRLSLVALQSDQRLSNHLFLTTDDIPAEAYDAFFITKPIELRFTNDLSERSMPAADGGLRFHCYPNPLTDQSRVHLNLPAPGPATCSIFNLQGQLLAQWTLNLDAGTVDLPLPANLPAGELILHVNTPCGNASSVVQKN